jgi:hypothetical protein
MTKDFKESSLQLLSKIQIAFSEITENLELKNIILNDLMLLAKNIDDINIYSLLSNDPEVLEWNILDVQGLVEIYGYNLSESDKNKLHLLIIENSDLINIENFESIHYQIEKYIDMESIFYDCPEIIEFININKRK